VLVGLWKFEDCTTTHITVGVCLGAAEQPEQPLAFLFVFVSLNKLLFLFWNTICPTFHASVSSVDVFFFYRKCVEKINTFSSRGGVGVIIIIFHFIRQHYSLTLR